MMCPMMFDPKMMVYMIIFKAAIVLWVLAVPLMIIWRLDKILKLMEEKKQ
ncbi:MAG: hypothetical protein P9M12_01030 [Candidatus Aceula lacicola]|nr:hypothetical protein [Candidatus Aceula lacicola]